MINHRPWMRLTNNPGWLITTVLWHCRLRHQLCTPCLNKKQAKLFLLQLCQTSTKSDNFWHKDGKRSKII